MSYEVANDNIRLYEERFPNAQEVALEATFLMRGDPDDFKRIPIQTARHVADTLLSTLSVVDIDPETVLVAGYNGLAPEYDAVVAPAREAISIYDDFSGVDLLFAPHEQFSDENPGECYRFIKPQHLLSDRGPIYTAGTSPGARIGVYDIERLAQVAPIDTSTRQWPIEIRANAQEVATARVLRFRPRYTFGVTPL